MSNPKEFIATPYEILMRIQRRHNPEYNFANAVDMFATWGQSHHPLSLDREILWQSAAISWASA